VVANQLLRRLEVVGRLHCQCGNSRHRALGEADEGAGRGELEHRGDPEVDHGLHAPVPANRAAHLPDEPAQDVGSPRDDLAIGVGQQRDARVADVEVGGELLEGVDSGRHVHGVEGAGDLQGDDPGLGRRVGGERRELLQGACGDGLPGTVGVGGRQAVPLQHLGDLGRVATEDGAHARRCERARCRHAAATLADEDHRVVVGQHPGEGGGGDLTDRVPRGDPDRTLRPVGEEHRGDCQPRSHDEGLGDGGVLDRLRVRGGAVDDQVETGDLGERLEPRAEGRELEPGGQEAGGLGALSRADDC
jgi:hypothetical protein